MSTTLDIALASLGGLVLAGVVAHGAWSARKAGPKRAAVRRGHAEPHQPHQPHEPREPVMEGLGLRDGADAWAAPGADAIGDDVFAQRMSRRRVNRLDALIDAIAPLRVEAPVAGTVVHPHLPTTRRAGGKPFQIEGLNSASGEWEIPAASAHYSEFQAGVQLANRTGPLNEIEFSEFVQKVQTFSDAIGALADFPDMLEAVVSARELDAFASQHDAQLAVQLHARGVAWSVGYLLQHAGRHGFVSGVVPGRLVLPGAEEGAPPVLTLSFDSQAALADDPNLATLRDVTLSFDVPQTEASAAPFAAWQASAQALALGMDAAIVDDHGRPLSPDGFAAIGTELNLLYGALEERDLAAGSAAARRLFS